MARFITLILIGVLMAGNASAKDIAKALGSQEATDPASMDQKRAYEKEKSGADLARQVLALPPLTPEQIEQFKAEGAWNDGLRQAPALQKRPPAGPAFKRNPWDS